MLLVNLHFVKHLERKQGRRLRPTRSATADKRTHFPVAGILEVSPPVYFPLSLSHTHKHTCTRLCFPNRIEKLYWCHSRFSDSAWSTVNPLGASFMRKPSTCCAFCSRSCVCVKTGQLCFAKGAAVRRSAAVRLMTRASHGNPKKANGHASLGWMGWMCMRGCCSLNPGCNQWLSS